MRGGGLNCIEPEGSRGMCDRVLTAGFLGGFSAFLHLLLFSGEGAFHLQCYGVGVVVDGYENAKWGWYRRKNAEYRI